MNATAPPARLTADEFARLCESESRVELIDGQVVRSPMPGGPHGHVVNTAAFLVTSFVKANGLGRVFGCDTFIVTRRDPDRVRGADVAYISFDRMPRGPIPPGPITVPPELVIEVRSPTDRRLELSVKAAEYIAAGVTVVIVLDPETESAAVHRGDDWPQVIHNGDELRVPDALPGFAVPVRRFFETE